MIASRSAAVLACAVARRRCNALVKSDEATALPGIVGALSALLETIENALADGADRPVVAGAVRVVLELSPPDVIRLDAAAARREASREGVVLLALDCLERAQ